MYSSCGSWVIEGLENPPSIIKGDKKETVKEHLAAKTKPTRLKDMDSAQSS